jgi:tRNA-specific 2-thiouridylase
LGFYTLGQRHLGMKGMGGAKNMYVAKKEKIGNVLVVAPKGHPSLFRKAASLVEVNYASRVKSGSEVLVRVRYRQPLFKASLSINGNKAKLIFSEPVPFVAPGQSAVFYSVSGEMLGGGIIL